MAALQNRAGHYIFALWFLSFFLLLFFHLPVPLLFTAHAMLVRALQALY